MRLGLGLALGMGGLRNRAPSDISLSASTVAEDAALGTVIGALSATDPEDDAVTFSLVDDADGLFGIAGSNLIVTGVLDYETAEEQAGGGGAPEWLPEGAIAHIDPVDEHYYADGAERALSDLFSGVNARDASGITVDGVADNYPVATALLRDAMPDSGWSMVIEWEQVGMEADRRLLVIHDALEEHGAEIVIQTDSELWLSSWFGGYDNSTSPITASLHKIGFSYNGSDFTLSSIDGATETVSSPGSDPIVVEIARFGTNIGNTNPLMGTLKKITIYEPMNQTQLNSITAP